MAELARLFVANQRGLFSSVIKTLMGRCAEELDFEKAAFYRDILLAVEKYWANKRYSVWLDDAVDTFAVEDTPTGFSVFLVTHRDRTVLGRKVFSVDREEAESSDLVLAEILESFYQFHLPREIRVSRDFVGRRELTGRLTAKFGRQARILVVNPATKGVNVARGLHLTHDEYELDKAKPLATPEVIARRLAKMFNLPKKKPRRVECFDVAHISGTGFVAASAVWEHGHFLAHDYTFLISSEKSELAVLADGVQKRLDGDKAKFPDLIVLDGGKPQLNAVLQSLADRPGHPPIVAAVKPPAKHSSIASFLSTDSPPIIFDVDSPAHAMLQLLRDAAHDLANRTHRDYREMMPFYELLGDYEPMIVPLRLHAENGGAGDLIPIAAR
ncbi:MAG: UvrB/UvrC motif-containing protein [Pyrinomonadaceae bacterium]